METSSTHPTSVTLDVQRELTKCLFYRKWLRLLTTSVLLPLSLSNFLWSALLRKYPESLVLQNCFNICLLLMGFVQFVYEIVVFLSLAKLEERLKKYNKTEYELPQYEETSTAAKSTSIEYVEEYHNDDYLLLNALHNRLCTITGSGCCVPALYSMWYIILVDDYSYELICFLFGIITSCFFLMHIFFLWNPVRIIAHPLAIQL
ncbi:hypothetical protein SJAG_05745 [Schizosaccharomyces japonicus yFS275]|uniref:Uncharacterized protein n=1 Tax=Schizosaccharomyces japonicus (strain yFS275 / FY16936) TaxID=402676 RepID=T0TAZ8_SCHJY|nr:hypothetical protein SJAG_05745 [Schizosaccharomyces japonicus yFS275]EQC52993.1 hypothetical protein SJAG_05745 [Schizosaccharomyces japonicus yFS275]